MKYTTIDSSAEAAINAQGGTIAEGTIEFPDGTGSTVLPEDEQENNFEYGEFDLPDGLLVFYVKGHVTLNDPKHKTHRIVTNNGVVTIAEY